MRLSYSGKLFALNVAITEERANLNPMPCQCPSRIIYGSAYVDVQLVCDKHDCIGIDLLGCARKPTDAPALSNYALRSAFSKAATMSARLGAIGRAYAILRNAIRFAASESWCRRAPEYPSVRSAISATTSSS